jgi:excisionase family DNA binding protein
MTKKQSPADELKALQERHPVCVNIREISLRTGLHRNTIYEHLRAHKIPHTKFGKRYIIVRERFEEWFKSRQIEPVHQYSDW